MQLDLTRLKTPNFQSLWVPVFGWDYCPLLRYGYGDLHHYHKFLIRTSPTLSFHHYILPSYGPAFHINLKQKSTTLSYLNCIKRSNEGFLSRKKIHFLMVSLHQIDSTLIQRNLVMHVYQTIA